MNLAFRNNPLKIAHVKKMLCRLLAQPMRQYEACEYAVKDSVSIKKALTVFIGFERRDLLERLERVTIRHLKLLKRVSYSTRFSVLMTSRLVINRIISRY